MRTGSRLLRILAGATLSLLATLSFAIPANASGAPAKTALPHSQAAPTECFHVTEAANIRATPYLSGTIVGVAYPDHCLDWTSSGEGDRVNVPGRCSMYTWAFVTDTNTGVQGYINMCYIRER
ncbi:hypothetical protein LX15_003868 [Streptoalloteichus tenebrarius]|uniref:SH3 domain-containing protein n=1 Tax=Streptoalloteichus tenebrarius (strain ATCC 17920 / DSM 40477 / JCM 4838 / CBS 697.72 / NBRC 16177 / NCIMB 11028 / NRRL B-12390 / A12253. 1 / ISP 5477) TaxID=1933 RepID=A0ABT1HXB9_STRSD|nr:hypothetical protein [Streptoalloteichus tenebrarius]BFF02638.1 hypothetical protein GCM10020241_43130 [Streptoalloteichus tenebrarius]